MEPLECTIISKDGTPIPVIKQKKIVKKSNKVKSVDNYDSDMLPPRDSRKVVPKVQLELYPYHTELIDNKYKNPLILVLLTSTNYRKGMKGDALDSLINKNVTGPPPERLIAKVFDVIDNEEAQVNINMREYTLFLSDLNMKYDALASMYFLPENVRWWALNFKHVMLVKARADGSLALFIDKKAIDTFISKEIRRANGETVSEGPSRAGSPMNKMRITSSSHSDGYASNYDNDELSPEPETNATPQEPLELELNDSEEGKPKRRKKKIKMTKTSAPSAVMAVSNSEPVLVKPVESVSKQKNAAKPTVTVKKAGIVSTIRSTTQSNNDNDIASVGKNSVPKMRPMNSKKLTTPIKQSAKPVPIAKPAPLVSKKVLPVQPKVAAGKDSAKNKFGKSSIASSSGDSAPTIAKKVSPKEKGSNNAALVSPKKSAVEPISPAPKGQSIDAKTHAEIVGAVTDSKNDCADEKQSYIAINETRARQASSSDLYEDKEFEEAAKTPKKSLERVTFDEGIKANTTSSNAKIGLSVDPIVELNQAAPLTAKSDGGYEDDNFDSPAETPLKGEKHTDMGNTQLSAKFSDEYDDDCFEDLPKTPAKPMEVFDDKTDSTGQKPVPKPPLDPRTNTKGKNEIVLQERKKEADESHDDAQSTVDDVSLLDLDPMDHIDGSEAHSHPENSNSAKPSNSTHGSKDDSDTNTVGLVLDPQADNNSVGLSIGDSVTYAEVISSISRHPEIVKAAPRAADANVPDAVPEEDDGTNAVLKLKDSSSSVVRSISNSQDKSVKEKGIALGGKLDDSADYSLSKDENEIQGIPIAQPSIDIVESESLYGVDFEHDSEVGDNTVANEKRKASIETTGSLSKPSAVSYNDDFEQSSVVLQ